MMVCENPGFLKGMIIVNGVIDVIRIVAPALVIITGIISFTKSVLSEDANAYKSSVRQLIEKFIISAFIFFIPVIFGSIIDLVDSKRGYESCFTNANKEYINKRYIEIASEKVAAAEASNNSRDYHKAVSAVNDVEDEKIKKDFENRLKVVKKNIDEATAEKIKKENERAQKEYDDYVKAHPEVLENDSGPLEAGGSTSTGNGKCQKHVVMNSEPDPSSAINCYTSIVSPNNFVYPKDSKTGLPLGAWPKNYGSIPTQLTDVKVYYGEFIFPTTPSNGVYHFVYNHNGMDIMANFGTPVYSPVDGTLLYSEWGHTSNKGGDETSYSISIELTNPVNVEGRKITTVFLTHMSGIRYRCSWGKCNRTVKKGELIGFVGNAAGSSTTGGWAPHLHATYYPTDYDRGLMTPSMEKLYDIPVGTSSYNIKAGG